MTVLAVMNVRTLSIALMCGLVAYTLWLLRSERLSAHIAVRWVLAECIAMAAFLLWQWLPLFRYTSSIGDRELLMVLAVIFFVLVTFLMLDSLVRISAQNLQIKRLAQEFALLQDRFERAHPQADKPTGASQPSPPLHDPPRLDDAARPDGGTVMSRIVAVGLSAWLLACVGTFVWQLQPSFPAAFSRLLTAQYLE